MTRTATRGALALAMVASILSCSENPSSVRPDALPKSSPPHAAIAAATAAPQLVISQVYGGGGNSGATYTNDFVEIFNPGSQAVSVNGWSIQYGSAANAPSAMTPLSGTIPAGGYYLVQEAKGAGGTTPLPTPDATGTIAMSGTNAKVALVPSTTLLTAPCPTGAVDLVSYGSTACSPATTAALTNSTAAIRKGSGCTYTADLTADFAIAAPTPRNSASPVNVCAGQLPLGPLDHVMIAGSTTVLAGSTTVLVATAQDANNQAIATATIAWASSDPSLATVDQTGKVTGVAATTTPVTITATATDAGITKTGTVQVTVNWPGINWIDVSSSSSSFPPGFQTQIFATAKVSKGGTVVPATFTFESLDPTVATVATVQNTGIVTGVAPSATKPGIRVTATPNGGGVAYSFIAQPVTIETPTAAPVSIYGTNDEFGDPTPATPANPDDRLIVRPQYVLSYSQTRGTPNWVSYELDLRQPGPESRCNCFTADPTLPAAAQIFTSDYTNGGYDRGHMAPSADRSAANLDNAATFYLTNIVPQTADLNQGVWENLESALRDSISSGARAAYIITGPLFAAGHPLSYLKNEGKVAIPDATWKVAVIGPRTGGAPFTRGSLQSWDDLTNVTVLAVSMPNIAGVRNDPWSKYLTTIDRIEAATGYDLLSLLKTAYQAALEAGDHGPVASFAIGGTQTQTAQLTFDASASTDPDLSRTGLDWTEHLSYSWQFSDGAVASGPVVNRPLPAGGALTATLVVADAFGWEKTVSHAVAVADAQANPGSIAMDETDGAIKITLYSAPGVDVTTLDLTTVRIGSAGVADRKVKVVAESKKQGSQLVLRIERQALLDAGLLTPETTSLLLTGLLQNGTPLYAAVAVDIH